MKTPRRARKKTKSQVSLETKLGQLENAQLVRRAEDADLAYLFKHALTQDTAYQSLLLKTRREVHKHVAESIERIYSDRLDEYASLLAQHYDQVGDDAKTLEYATRAGDLAARVYAGAEATANYSLAIRAAKRMAPSDGRNSAKSLRELYLKRGRSLELLSRFDEAARSYDEMEETAHELGDRALELAALTAKATVRSIPGSARDLEQARVLSGQALELARELGDRAAEAKILWSQLVSAVYSYGDPHDAIRLGEESLAIARELNLREQLAYTLHDLFVAYTYVGDMQKARTVRSEATQLWRELDNKPMLAESVTGLALLHFLTGELDQAISLAQDGYGSSLTISNLGGQGFAGYILGLIHLELGELDQSIRFMKAGLPIAELGGLSGNGISPHGMIGWIYAYLGDHFGAHQWLQTALNLPSIAFGYQRLWVHAQHARVELLGSNLPTAERAFRDGGVLPLPDKISVLFPGGAAVPHFAAAELALAQKDYALAISMMDALLTHLNEINVRIFLPEALYIKGRALCESGQLDPAMETWQVARTLAKTMGLRRILWQILLAMSQAEDGRGNHAYALELAAQSRPLVEYIAAHVPLELRESFRRLPIVQTALNPPKEPA